VRATRVRRFCWNRLSCQRVVEPLERRDIFLIRLCSDGAAYEAIPKRRLRIDIPELKLALERDSDCEVTLSSSQFLVVKRKDTVEVTFVEDGRMIIRNVSDEGAARRIAEGILPARAVLDR
jgi:hypothetical protein